MDIIITGAYGFVGTNLSKAVKNDLNTRLIAVDISKKQNQFYDDFFTWTDLKHIDRNIL